MQNCRTLWLKAAPSVQIFDAKMDTPTNSVPKSHLQDEKAFHWLDAHFCSLTTMQMHMEMRNNAKCSAFRLGVGKVMAHQWTADKNHRHSFPGYYCFTDENQKEEHPTLHHHYCITVNDNDRESIHHG